MDSSLPDGQLSPLDQTRDKQLLQAWIVAINAFYHYYSQLCGYANTYQTQQTITPHPTAYVGQCSVDRLESLLETMQQQLDKLLLDLDQPALVKAQWTAQKLLLHTQVLNQINQQALAVCQLASQSAS